jgi:hypothetical protein
MNPVITCMNLEFEQLKKDIYSDDWDLVATSADRLAEIGGEEVIDFLILCIASDNRHLRNRVAIALSHIKDNRALEPLLAAIFKKENHKRNGTMVYALESLDCSQNLKEIFKILFFEALESKISAHSILSKQLFDLKRKDLLEIQQMWDDCKLHPEKCPLYDEIETREVMQGNVDGFMGYLRSKRKKRVKRLK